MVHPHKGTKQNTMSGQVMTRQLLKRSGDAVALKLAKHIAALPGDRVLVAIAGAPGSGKSTLTAQVVARLEAAVLVPMDGFHLDDSVLHKRGLLARKGAIETFDAAGFAALVERLAKPGHEVIYPVFDRSREIAIAGAGIVSADDRIVVIEGNYLLSTIRPWGDIRYDVTVILQVPEPVLQKRLARRWKSFGKDQQSIAAHLDNDLKNARMVIQTARAADIVVQQGEGES